MEFGLALCHGWDFSGYSHISGFRYLSESNKNGFEMHFESEFWHFRIQNWKIWKLLLRPRARRKCKWEQKNRWVKNQRGKSLRGTLKQVCTAKSWGCLPLFLVITAHGTHYIFHIESGLCHGRKILMHCSCTPHALMMCLHADNTWVFFPDV